VNAEFDLSGRVAIVTGAGHSIGRATALALAGAGADVALAGRRIGPLEDTAAEVTRHGVRAMAMECDVSEERDVRLLAERCARELGSPEVLVANAGVFQEWGPSELLGLEEWDRVESINLRGLWICCQEVGRRMIASGRGSIVTISSIGGMVAIPNAVSYTAAKFGVVGITKALAAEWAQHGVRVNCVAPGYVRRDVETLEDSPEVLAGVLARTPMGRLGEPREVGLAVAFLASGAAGFITGATLVVDGGWLTT